MFILKGNLNIRIIFICLFGIVPFLIEQKSVAQGTQQELDKPIIVGGTSLSQKVQKSLAMKTISDLAKAAKKAAFCRNSTEMIEFLTLNGENENDPALYQLFLGLLVVPLKIVGDAAFIDWNAHVSLSDEVSNVIENRTCQFSNENYPYLAAFVKLRQDYSERSSNEDKNIKADPDQCDDKVENAMALVAELLDRTFSHCEER
jgi:hypothetical protein